MAPKKKDQADATAAAEAQRNNLAALTRMTLLELREDWDDTISGEYECRLIVNEVVEAMEEEIVRTHMDHTSVPWTVQSVLTDLMEALQLNFVEREDPGGFSDVENFDEGFDVHVDVFEPSTIVPDPWARASILNRRQLLRKEPEEQQKPGRVGSASSGASGARGGFGEARNRNLLSASDANFAASSMDAAGSSTLGASQQHQQSRSGPSLSKSGKSASGKKSGQQHETPRAPSTVDDAPQLKTEEELRLLSEMAEEKRRMEHLRSVSNKVHQQMAELKNVQNQTIVVDGATHTVLVVNAPDPKQLPPTVQEVRIMTDDDIAAAAAAKAAAAAARRGGTPGLNNSSGGGIGSAKKQRKRPDTSNAVFWEAESKTAPMITGVNPNPGVTAREGDIVRRAELKPQKMRVSKSEYAKQQQIAQATAPQVVDIDELVRKPPPNPASVAKALTAVSKLAGGSIASSPLRATSDAPVGFAGGNPGSEVVPVAAGSGAKVVKQPQTVAPQGPAALPKSRVTTPSFQDRRPSSRLATPSGARKGDYHSPNTQHIHPLVDYRSRPNSPDLEPTVAGSAAKYLLRRQGGGGGAGGVGGSRPHSSMSLVREVDDDVARDFLDSIHLSLNSTAPLLGEQRSASSFE